MNSTPSTAIRRRIEYATPPHTANPRRARIHDDDASSTPAQRCTKRPDAAHRPDMRRATVPLKSDRQPRGRTEGAEPPRQNRGRTDARTMDMERHLRLLRKRGPARRRNRRRHQHRRRRRLPDLPRAGSLRPRHPRRAPVRKEPVLQHRRRTRGPDTTAPGKERSRTCAGHGTKREHVQRNRHPRCDRGRLRRNRLRRPVPGSTDTPIRNAHPRRERVPPLLGAPASILRTGEPHATPDKAERDSLGSDRQEKTDSAYRPLPRARGSTVRIPVKDLK